MTRRADAVLLESVVGALDGAREVHDEFAQRYGYRVYRVLQNAATFGVPQDRERFWAVFMRDGVTRDRVWFSHHPRRCTIGDVLDQDPGRPIGAVASRVKRQREVLLGALDPVDADRVLSGECGFGAIRKAIASARGCRKLSADDERRLCLNGFRSDHIHLLDPNGVATTLLKNSTWMCRGRALTALEYKRVMGFPDSYRFPVDDWRPLITKGVCPPVAAWLLDQVLSWIEGVSPVSGATWVEPGGVLDIRPSRGSL
jgi:site-specific DNA-cytosine methylase